MRPGERLVWADQPVADLYAQQARGLVLFGVIWLALSIFWMFGAAISVFKPGHLGATVSLSLFGLPFVVLGVLLIYSPEWMRRVARRSVYIITDQRAIVLLGRAFGRTEVQTFPPDRLRKIASTEHPDGSGDLIFEHYWRVVGRRSTVVRRGFIAVRNVLEVENLIYKTL